MLLFVASLFGVLDISFQTQHAISMRKMDVNYRINTTPPKKHHGVFLQAQDKNTVWRKPKWDRIPSK